MQLHNFYEDRRSRLLMVLPIILLLVSLYYIPRIQLDSSLKGGITIQLQTNSTIDARTLTSQIDAAIPGAQAEVSRASKGISITIVSNSSLAGAQQILLDMYGEQGAYSAAVVQIARLQGIAANSTAGTNNSINTSIAAYRANETAALAKLANYSKEMQTSLAPLLAGGAQPTYNASSPSSMVAFGNEEYSNASSAYKAIVIGKIGKMVPFSAYTYQEVTPTLGSYFLGEIEGVIIASFILVALVVLIIFRTPIPAIAVVFGSANDLAVALGAMGLLGIPLGVASIGGLLMLIGYSIDTDMLSAVRILKRTDGTPSSRAFSTLETGLTMTFSALIPFSILLVLAYLTFIPTYLQIAAVVIFGLVGDIFTTWFGNANMILWYKERKDAVIR